MVEQSSPQPLRRTHWSPKVVPILPVNDNPPSGIRLPFSVSYYTEAYCKAKKIWRTASRPNWPLNLSASCLCPQERRVVVLGDTAFDAEAIHTACEERKFSWIVPINPERVLAGEKPRFKVSSLSEDLTADQMVCLKVHPGKGKYVDYRLSVRGTFVQIAWRFLLENPGFSG